MMASSILSSSFAVASRSQPHPLCRSSCCHCGVADTLWWSLRGRAAAKLWIKSEKGPRESKLLESGFWNWPKNQFVRPSKIFVLDPGGAAPDSGGQENFDGDRSMSGRTRLEIIVRAAANELLKKLNAARKNFPMKIFLLLLGFYTANALATILGQTGDWDVLVAGVVVAAIEGIGMLMYKKPMSDPNGRLKSFVVMVNFWKAGVCLGLFVDAFKLGS